MLLTYQHAHEQLGGADRIRFVTPSRKEVADPEVPTLNRSPTDPAEPEVYL